MADSADAAAGLQWETPSPPETPVKALVLDSSHTSMSGVFYPKGHVLVLFPSAELARQAADALEASHSAVETAYAEPQTLLQDVVRTLGSGDTPLPSVGAEGDFVRRIADLAGTGHHALLIPMGKDDNADALAAQLQGAGAVAAFHYRSLVIEELITQPSADRPQSVTVGTRAAAPQPGER